MVIREPVLISLAGSFVGAKLARQMQRVSAEIHGKA